MMATAGRPQGMCACMTTHSAHGPDASPDCLAASHPNQCVKCSEECITGVSLEGLGKDEDDKVVYAPISTPAPETHQE